MSRITKDPEERKNEIMEAAQELFITKGFEQTSVSDIVRKVGVAQGLFYYYFKSKDEMLDAILDRHMNDFLRAVADVTNDKNSNAIQKLHMLVNRTYSLEGGSKRVLEYVHREENAVIHNRVAGKLIGQCMPLVAGIIRQGVEEGLFDTPYPDETAEVLIIGVGFLHDSIHVMKDGILEARRALASVDIVERLLGAKKGSFSLLNEEQKN